MRILRDIYTEPRLYTASTILILMFVLGYFFSPLFFAAKILLLFFLFLLASDLSLLFFTGQQNLLLRREVPERLSNGDDNQIRIFLKNNYFFTVHLNIIDEIPARFQTRDFIMRICLMPQEEKMLDYSLRPVRRGEYEFGKTNAFVSSKLKLFSRGYQFGSPSTPVKVYPSFLRMKEYELLAISNRLTEAGIKRIRKVGTHTEFDQIRDYVTGDDYRTINWKATAKKSKLMVNQYQEERSQQVYSLIDMGRVMKMPFNGMSLLDYAINSALILSNTALYKHDKTGIITFGKTIGSFLPAENKSRTILKTLETLYKQETSYDEPDYELLAAFIKQRITHRSLLILYTNFESPASLQRQLFCLRNMARNHLLMVIIFENTEIRHLLDKTADSLQDIYIKTIAEKFIYDKRLIVKELNKHGIHALQTKPASLSVNLINKYLELKHTGII